VYNNRTHSNLKYSPIVCHNDTHIASLVSRRIIAQHVKHKSDSKAFFERNPRRNFSVGEKVLIKVVKKKVQKQSSSVYYPNYTQKLYTVKDVDRTKYPATYAIEEVPGSRRFYDFELTKVDPLFEELSATTKGNNFLMVEDVEDSSSLKPYLRSGTTPTSKRSVLYKVRKNGQVKLMTQEQLQRFKVLFGANSLRYSPIFHLEPKLSYVI